MHFLWVNVLCIPIYVISAFVNGYIAFIAVALSLVLTIKWMISGKIKNSSYTDYGYILNKNTGVIRSWFDSSVSNVSEHNRKHISFEKAHELVEKGTKYRFKK